MMSEADLIVHVNEIESFTLPGNEGVYESQCLIDREGVGSERLGVNRFTLKAGKELRALSHPVGADECYYVLHGQARLTLGGDPQTGEGSSVHEIGPDTAVFIPGGTYHGIENPGAEDLVLLTMWPTLPTPGANHIYDARKHAWGTSFRKKAAPTS